MRAPTVWITGLPGSGKSTVAALVAEELRARGVRVEVLDGEEARRRLSPELGWTRAERLLHGQRLSEEAVRLNDAGIAVVVAAVSPYEDGRVRARALIGPGFLEVYTACSVATCSRRDAKGLYARAVAGQLPGFTGVDDPYEAPMRPDVVLDTEHTTPEEAAASVLLRLDGVARTPPLNPHLRYHDASMYRHGDVLIAPVDAIPAGAQARPGATVAHGEITGHSHRFEDPAAVRLYALGGDLFVEVLTPAARIVHEEHGPISIPNGCYRVWRQREYSPREIRTIAD